MLKKCIILSAIIFLMITGCATTEKNKGGKKSVFLKPVLLINCGSYEDYTDNKGRKWAADQEYKKGKWGYVYGETINRDYLKIKGTKDAKIYQDERYSMDAYKIPLKNGKYKVKLHFAENYDGIYEDKMRLFSVTIEGKPFLKGFDIFKEAGINKAIEKEIVIDIQDEELTIEFSINIQNPFINGIEILK